ncbi:hydrolase [Bacillus weihaiensis]|uniref:Hydrolase n=1 Tax=Bacillus weihaiensis TaxID=1547283 RepID=A0A1L3MNR5_9BACI|nr:hydrolase [Bacillus weihaiensis]APH03985.1 hydrolase [Bacillus weihaiensis]
MEDKKTYYISMGSGEISQLSTVSSWNYKIEATEEEIIQLREYFDQVYSSDVQGFLRSHTPYVQYHYDRENDAIDDTNIKIYRMIYELGDEEAKNHIQTHQLMSKIAEQE